MSRKSVALSRKVRQFCVERDKSVRDCSKGGNPWLRRRELDKALPAMQPVNAGPHFIKRFERVIREARG